MFAIILWELACKRTNPQDLQAESIHSPAGRLTSGMSRHRPVTATASLQLAVSCKFNCWKCREHNQHGAARAVARRASAAAVGDPVHRFDVVCTGWCPDYP